MVQLPIYYSTMQALAVAAGLLQGRAMSGSVRSRFAGTGLLRLPCLLPMLQAADEAHIVSTSSVNGFWASIGPLLHTAYAAAKFAVKGLVRHHYRSQINAPHINVSVVMPGHIGTSIAINSEGAGSF